MGTFFELQSMFSLTSRFQSWYRGLFTLFFVFLCPFALHIAWGGQTVRAFTVFFFLFPLLVAEQYFCKSKPTKYFIGFFSIVTFHFLSGFTLFTEIEPKIVAIILFANSVVLSIPWLLYVKVRENLNLHLSLIFLITSWLSVEYLSTHTNTLTPWYNLGNSLAGWVKLVQWYEYTGVLGGSLWILVVNILAFYSLHMLLKKESISCICGFILFILCFVFPQIISTKIETNNIGTKIEVLVVSVNDSPKTSLMRVTLRSFSL